MRPFPRNALIWATITTSTLIWGFAALMIVVVLAGIFVLHWGVKFEGTLDEILREQKRQKRQLTAIAARQVPPHDEG